MDAYYNNRYIPVFIRITGKAYPDRPKARRRGGLHKEEKEWIKVRS